MSPLRTVVQHRRIDIAAPDEIPDGTAVEVHIVPAHDSCGLSEAEWDDSPSGSVTWIAWLDSLQPLVFTKPEQHQLDEDCERQRRWELDQFVLHADQLLSDWE